MLTPLPPPSKLKRSVGVWRLRIKGTATRRDCHQFSPLSCKLLAQLHKHKRTNMGNSCWGRRHWCRNTEPEVRNEQSFWTSCAWKPVFALIPSIEQSKRLDFLPTSTYYECWAFLSLFAIKIKNSHMFLIVDQCTVSLSLPLGYTATKTGYYLLFVGFRYASAPPLRTTVFLGSLTPKNSDLCYFWPISVKKLSPLLRRRYQSLVVPLTSACSTCQREKV